MTRRARESSAGDASAGAVSGGAFGVREVLRVVDGAAEAATDRLAQEVPVAFVVDGEPHAVMMATPLDLEDYARGFAATEALGEVRSIEVRDLLEGVQIAIDTEGGAHRASRALVGRTGCGLCGTRTLEAAIRPVARVTAEVRVSHAALRRALDALAARQPLNALTGSLHAAAWADTEGDIVCVREDVGRHNALDKLIGARMVGSREPRSNEGFLVLTSRASYEMVAKAAQAGIAFVAAISAPTTLAVHVARDAGVTLVGFARASRCVVYTHGERFLP